MAADKSLESVITHLSSAIGHARLHPLHNSLVQETIQSALQAIQASCRESSADAVQIRIQSGQFVSESNLLIGATIAGYKLIDLFRRSSAGGLLIQRGVRKEDLAAFLHFALETKSGRAEPLRESQAHLESRGCQSIELLPTDENHTWFSAGAVEEKWEKVNISLGESVEVHQTMFENVEDSMRKAAGGDSVNMDEARAASEQLRESLAGGFDNAFQLANYTSYDTYTVGHSIRVALLSVYVGSRLGAPPELLTEIGAAGLMHDVGKGRVPHEILYKPGQLDVEERRIMSEHPRLGAEILIESADPSPCALGAAWGHHLRFDGTGYPTTSAWARTSRITSLIQVCDVFEALTSERPYKAAMSPAHAYDIMFEETGAFDPSALSAFTRAMGFYPPGSFIRLSDGRLARVHRPGKTLDRPTVRDLLAGTMMDLEHPDAAHLSVVDFVADTDALEELELESPKAPLPAAEEKQSCPEPDEHSTHASDSDDCRLC